MSEASITLLVCLGVIAVLAALVYTTGRGYAAALSGLGTLRRDLDQILAKAQVNERTLIHMRRVLCDAHRKIHTVTKGLEKPAP